MAIESLQAHIGTAVVDERFRRALLGESRSRAVSDFDLSLEEREAVIEMRAESLEQFASQLDNWILKKQGWVEPPVLMIPSRSPRVIHPEHESSSNSAPARNVHVLPALVS